MITIRMKATNKIRVVTPNIAHDLIDRGDAELVTRPTIKPQAEYGNRQFRSTKKLK